MKEHLMDEDLYGDGYDFKKDLEIKHRNGTDMFLPLTDIRMYYVCHASYPNTHGLYGYVLYTVVMSEQETTEGKIVHFATPIRTFHTELAGCIEQTVRKIDYLDLMYHDMFNPSMMYARMDYAPVTVPLDGDDDEGNDGSREKPFIIFRAIGDKYSCGIWYAHNWVDTLFKPIQW